MTDQTDAVSPLEVVATCYLLMCESLSQQVVVELLRDGPFGCMKIQRANDERIQGRRIQRNDEHRRRADTTSRLYGAAGDDHNKPVLGQESICPIFNIPHFVMQPNLVTYTVKRLHSKARGRRAVAIDPGMFLPLSFFIRNSLFEIRHSLGSACFYRDGVINSHLFAVDQCHCSRDMKNGPYSGYLENPGGRRLLS